jgi:excisionase family DNA binding protein
VTTGRPLLGAHVSGPAALWLLRRAEDGGQAADAVRHFQSIGRPDIAANIAAAVDQLREAARLWEQRRDETASADGNAETATTEAAPESDLLGGMPTAGAATLLGVTERRVRQLLDGGLLAGRKVGRQWLVDRDSIETYRTDRRLAG